MGLKQNIVIKNQFTIKDKFGGGSRGKTPGNYVLQYMLRDDAVEDLTPTKLDDFDTYSDRLFRKEDIITKNKNLQKIKKDIERNDKLSGISFGKFGNSSLADLSMSDNNVKKMSKKIQKAFEENKTILKTVLSFDEDYLKEMGVVSDDFSLNKAGDYKGNLDQLKLRSAICKGLDNMSKNFSNLNYIGCLQVDTKHIHAHLCMYDEGVGRLKENGEQVGKLNEKDKSMLRRHIDMDLGFSKNIKVLSSNYSYTKTNSKTYVKKYAHKMMRESGLSQLILASLPDNKNLWRANTNNKQMRNANRLVGFFVDEVLKKDDSGYKDALNSINKYAYSRYEREGLSDKEYRTLLKNGEMRLRNDCMNGVYQVLKTIDKSDLNIRTKSIDYFTTDYNILANMKDINYNSGNNPDKMIEFSFKLRSYSNRLNYHKNKKNKNYESSKLFKEAEKKGEVTEDAYAMLNYYNMEKKYHQMLMSKYQHFLNFLPIKDVYNEDFEKLSEKRKKLVNFNDLLNDDTFKKFKSEKNAEDYGREVYDINGGRFMVSNRGFMERSFINLRDRYINDREDFRERLRDDSLHLSKNGPLKISNEPYYDFDNVKALDLHHMDYDFYEDVDVSKFNIDNFSEMAHKREKAYLDAKNYLELTGQKDEIKNLDGEDIELMVKFAKTLDDTGVLQSLKTGDGEIRRTRTIALNEYLNDDLEKIVRNTISRAVEMESFGE